MNALVKKEIRLLLPSFLIGVLLTFVNCYFKANDLGFNAFTSVVSIVGCAAMAVFMALNSFGAEMSAGTFSMLLTQPVTRQRIWRTKTSLLASALIIGGCLWCGILYLRFEVFDHQKVLGNFSDVLLGTWIFLLVIYSGALWTVLLLRQVAAAFWFTLLVPGAIWMFVAGLWPEKYAASREPAVVVALVIYSVAGIWFARRLFLQAQDVAWTGGAIALPEMRGLAGFKLGSGNRRLWRPRAALLVKEFQLHQSQFVVAGVLALLHLGVLATRKLGNFPQNSALEFVLEIFWGLWLVLPMLVGAAAVAEERKLGTLEGQLCLPVRRRTQFAAKAGVVVLLTLLFGVAMPLLLEGTRILPNVHSNFGHITAMLDLHGAMDWSLQLSTAQVFFWNCAVVIVGLLPLLTLTGIAAMIGLISFFASTLTRNTLQALAPAVLGLLMTYFLLFMAAGPENLGFHIHLPWQGDLIYLIGVPVLAATLATLACRNFQRVFIGGRVWLRNALGLLAMLGLVMVATTAIYHRVWEKLAPFEPPHGPVRLSPANPPVLNDDWNIFSARLPDGRIWADNFTSQLNPLALLLGNLRLTSQGGGHFYEGSNWVSMVGSPWRELAGLKTDGTLWVSEKPAHRERLADGKWKMIQAGNFIRIGSDTDWNSLVWNGLNVLLVKNDGTLWRWGVTNWNYKLHQWPGLAAFTPRRLGAETNWAEVVMSDQQHCLRKTDGTVWTTWNSNGDDRQTLKLEPGFSVERVAYFEPGQWRSTTMIRSGLSYHMGVREDGTFRIRADQTLKKMKNSNSYQLVTAGVDLQLGQGTNWLAVAGRGQKVVTLKDNGTLWLWNFYHNDRRGWDPGRNEREMLEVKPVRLGIHSDWIAIASADGGIISLAADGSLWYWPLEFSDDFKQQYDSGYGDGSHFDPLLDTSRKPQLLGNVFGRDE